MPKQAKGRATRSGRAAIIQRYHAKRTRIKDARVFKSSHGKFNTVAELEAHREKVSVQKGKKQKKEKTDD
jgi:hypothetical protein